MRRSSQPIIDTMETAFPWSKLEAGHARVVEAMRRAALEHAGAGFAMGHVSHIAADIALAPGGTVSGSLRRVTLLPAKP